MGDGQLESHFLQLLIVFAWVINLIFYDRTLQKLHVISYQTSKLIHTEPDYVFFYLRMVERVTHLASKHCIHPGCAMQSCMCRSTRRFF